MFSKSAFGKIISIINLACALCSFFIYWKFFDINIFISILLAIISWFFVTYILDKAIIKFWGVEQKLKKMND